MSETPRYASLSDYLHVIRAQKVLIIVVTALFAAAGLGVSLLQTPRYTAESSLIFRDIEQDLSLLGQTALPELAPDQRAAVNAELVTRRNVAERVKASLDTDLTVGQLQSAVTTQVGTRTNFVVIQATSEDAKFAAALANEYARQVQALDRDEVRARLDTAIKTLRQGLPSDPAAAAGSLTQAQISQLQTVRQLAEPVEIAEPAGVPAAPSSPRTRRNTVLGLLVGLALGLLAAFLRDSLDRRLRGFDEVQEEMQLPVIGRVPNDALGAVGHLGNGAAGPGREAETHLEAFRVLRKNLEFLQAGEPMRSVLVTSGRPEEGKSTVSIALACAAAMAGKRTLLVECDLRRPCLADRLGLQGEPGLTDYLVGDASPSDVLQVMTLSPTDLNASNGKDKPEKADAKTVEGAKMVCIVAGSSSPLPAELLGSSRFEDFLSKVSKAYDLVVLDTSPILTVVDALELVPQVDGMIVCVRLSQTTRQEAHAAREALSHLPGRPTGVVVTGVRGREDAYGYYGSYGS
jgi:tyrosine-protein kinase